VRRYLFLFGLANLHQAGALCDVYGARTAKRDELVQLATTLKASIIEPARITLSRGAPLHQQRIRRMEGSATLLRGFQNTMVVGLLQTPAYARLVFTSGVPDAEADQAVAARLERQAQLRDRVPQAVLIMTEGALRWQAGSPALMAEQVEAIITATEVPNVEIGIIPYTTPATFFPPPRLPHLRPRRGRHRHGGRHGHHHGPRRHCPPREYVHPTTGHCLHRFRSPRRPQAHRHRLPEPLSRPDARGARTPVPRRKCLPTILADGLCRHVISRYQGLQGSRGIQESGCGGRRVGQGPPQKPHHTHRTTR
jgi:hypothetical protein